MTDLIKLTFKNEEMSKNKENVDWLNKVQDQLNEEFADVIDKACMDSMLYGTGVIKMSIDSEKDITKLKYVKLSEINKDDV